MAKKGNAWRVAAAVYAVAGLSSVALMSASATGSFGIAEDPLSALPAILLGLPWSLLAGLLPPMPPLTGILFLLASIALNTGLLLFLGRRASKKGART